MSERTYTREDIKQAFQAAYAWGWYDACAVAEIKHRIDMGPLNERRAKQHNPYEQEEEGTNDDEGMQRSGVQEEV